MTNYTIFFLFSNTVHHYISKRSTPSDCEEAIKKVCDMITIGASNHLSYYNPPTILYGTFRRGVTGINQSEQIGSSRLVRTLSKKVREDVVDVLWLSFKLGWLYETRISDKISRCSREENCVLRIICQWRTVWSYLTLVTTVHSYIQPEVLTIVATSELQKLKPLLQMYFFVDRRKPKRSKYKQEYNYE